VPMKDNTAQGWALKGIAGVGLGLRSQHIDEVLLTQPVVPWFELLTENHLAPGGLIPVQLEAIRSNYPITLHCVGMSLGGTDPVDVEYLHGIKTLIERYQPSLVSDHLCFSQHGQHNYHDLLPLPYNEETLNHFRKRITQIQDILETRILVENVSSYLTYRASTASEAEFISELLSRTDCNLLLDINNIYVNAVNHGFSAREYLNRIPMQRVREIHLAGYEDRGSYLLDAHSNRVSPPVWALYEEVISKYPNIPTLIEWDNDIPSFATLREEAGAASALMQRHRSAA
jgi:uncharacterized protein (UPF0276 family)